jgi:hypothetical protein
VDSHIASYRPVGCHLFPQSHVGRDGILQASYRLVGSILKKEKREKEMDKSEDYVEQGSDLDY